MSDKINQCYNGWKGTLCIAGACILAVCGPARGANPARVPPIYHPGPSTTGLPPSSPLNTHWIVPERRTVKKICKDIQAAIDNIKREKTKQIKKCQKKGRKFNYSYVSSRTKPDVKTISWGITALLGIYFDDKWITDFLIPKKLPDKRDVYLRNRKFNGLAGNVAHRFLYRGENRFVDGKTPKPAKGDIELHVVPTIMKYLESEVGYDYSSARGFTSSGNINGQKIESYCLLLLWRFRNHPYPVSERVKSALLKYTDHESHYIARLAKCILIDEAILDNKPVNHLIVQRLLKNIDPAQNQKHGQAGKWRAVTNGRPYTLPYRKQHLAEFEIYIIRTDSFNLLGYTGITGKAALPVLRGYFRHVHMPFRDSASRAYIKICRAAKVDPKDPGWLEAIATQKEWEKFAKEWEKKYGK